MSHTDEPLGRQVLAGAQMLFVAFGALVLMPLITGMDPKWPYSPPALEHCCFR
jgi:Xanthine/uracil permeases